MTIEVSKPALPETTIYALHKRVLRETFPGGLNDSDAFLVFGLLHSFKVILSGPILSDRKGIGSVAAITQRHASEALAALWAGSNDERANDAYWYFRWNGEWQGYDHFDNLSPAETERLSGLKHQLLQHPFIADFAEDD